MFSSDGRNTKCTCIAIWQKGGERAYRKRREERGEIEHTIIYLRGEIDVKLWSRCHVVHHHLSGPTKRHQWLHKWSKRERKEEKGSKTKQILSPFLVWCWKSYPCPFAILHPSPIRAPSSPFFVFVVFTGISPLLSIHSAILKESKDGGNDEEDDADDGGGDDDNDDGGGERNAR